MKFYCKIFYLVIAAFLFYSTEKFCHKQTDGFQTVKIISDIPYSLEWETGSIASKDSSKLQELFSQPFHYLDSGGQSYAFLSQDEKVVLKLFKMHHLRQYPWLYRTHLPGLLDSYRIQFLLYQKQKLQRAFSSSTIAYNALKEETGLLYLNLNVPRADFATLRIKLIDKLGIAHELDLCHIPFVLQYRADNAFKTLRVHLGHKDIPAAKQVIKEIIDCLKARYQKGIKDLDPALRRNIGLIKDRAIAIDIGAFFQTDVPMSQEEMKQELTDDTRRMRKWLKKRSLELTAYFDSLIECNSATEADCEVRPG